MELDERIAAMAKLGFFKSVDGFSAKSLATEVRNGGIDASRYPATAILSAAGLLLEIPADSAEQPEDYADILEQVSEFCGAFRLGNVKLNPGGETTAEGELFELKYELDGRRYETEILHDPEQVDLGFMVEIEQHLEAIREPRRLCPVVEIMDDTARYVFLDPEIVEQAELDEIIGAPDFEEG